LTSRELLDFLRQLRGVRLAGLDVDEVAPPLDVGHVTSLAALKFIFEYIGMVKLENGLTSSSSGAGVMGCSLAFYLSRAGRHVIVIDRGRIGQGATVACAGGIRAQFSTEINVRIGMEAKRLLARFAEETGQTADSVRSAICSF